MLARAFVVLLIVPLWVSSAVAQEEPSPLAPPDTSSPRATMQSFIDVQRTIHDLIKADPLIERSETDVGLTTNLDRGQSLFDMSQIAPSLVEDAGGLAVVLLSEIFDRIELPLPSDIPDAETAQAEELTQWRVPNTEITLVLMEEGPRANAWLFNTDTVRNLPQWESAVHELPYRADAIIGRASEIGGALDYWKRFPGVDSVVPKSLVVKMPPALQREVWSEPVWKLLAFVPVLGIGFFAVILVVRFGGWLKKRMQGAVSWHRLVAPAGIAGVVLLADEAAGQLGVVSLWALMLGSFLEMIAFVILAWITFVLSGLVAEWIITSPRIKPDSINASLVRLVARIGGVLLALWPLVAGAERLGISALPLLAGLGVGGLAIALAVRPTLENVIGGFILFADRPVRVGDICRFGDKLGTIEGIGLRSTRVRTFDDTVVTVPNAEFSQLQLENISRRRRTLWNTILGLRYETTADQLRYALANIRKMLRSHPKVAPEKLRVRFRRFGDFSLDIEIFAYIKTNQWPEYYAVLEDLNLRLMDIVKEAGTGFAFPSQTMYFTRDSGLDTARGEAAAAAVSEWQDADVLPLRRSE